MRRSRILPWAVLAVWCLPTLGGAVAAPLHAASHPAAPQEPHGTWRPAPGGVDHHHHGGLDEGSARVGSRDRNAAELPGHHHAQDPADHHHAHGPADHHPAQGDAAHGASPSGDSPHRSSTRMSPAAPADPPPAAMAAWIQALLHGHHHGASDPGHEHPANPSAPHVPAVPAPAPAVAGAVTEVPSQGAGAVLRPGPGILPSSPLLHTLCSYLL